MTQALQQSPSTTSTLNDRIRRRAYELWAANGYPDGNAEQHWLSAERELLGSTLGATASTASPSRPRVAKKASAAPVGTATRSGKKAVRLAS